jgi:hypothetical protein
MVSATLLTTASVPGYISITQLKSILKHHVELLLFLGVFFAYLYATSFDKKMMQTVLENPRKSDFFYVDYYQINPNSDARFRYVPMKVIQKDGQNLMFKVGNLAHTTPVSPRQHAKFDKAVLMRNYYRADSLTLSLDQINQMVEAGIIYNARRPQSIYIGGWIVIHEHEMYVDPNR